MGNYNPDSNALENGHSISSYYQDSNEKDITVSSGNLINMSLQNNLVFKITT